jgi:hypothetical protein
MLTPYLFGLGSLPQHLPQQNESVMPITPPTWCWRGGPLVETGGRSRHAGNRPRPLSGPGLPGPGRRAARRSTPRGLLSE